MARKSNNTNHEALVPISAVADRLNYPGEMVWRRLDESDVVADWDGTPCLGWSTAKVLFEQLSAEKAAHDAENQRRLGEQLDAEQYARLAPVRAYEEALAAGPNQPGAVAFGPGDPEPAWVEAPSGVEQ